MGMGPMAGGPSEGREATGQTGTGGGFGVRAQTAGVYEFKGESVHCVPSVDVNQVILGGQIVMIVLLLAIRAIANIGEDGRTGGSRTACAAPASARAATVEGLRHRVGR